MKKIGFLIITIGFLCGALSTVVDKEAVKWPYLICSLVIGIIGIFIVRVSDKKVRKSKETITKNIETINSSLSNIVNNIQILNSKKHEINTYDIRHEIDNLFPQDLNNFVETRESISHTYGLKAYAEVMSTFAAGERYLNRVWSASADGYIDEVNTYLDKTQEQFMDSLEKLKSFSIGEAL